MWREEHKMVAYQEIDESTKAQPASGRSRSRYIVGEFPFRIQSTPQPLNKPNPKLGVGEPLRILAVTEIQAVVSAPLQQCELAIRLPVIQQWL